MTADPKHFLPLGAPPPTAETGKAAIRVTEFLSPGIKAKLCTAIDIGVQAVRPDLDRATASRMVLLSCASFAPLMRKSPAELGMSPQRFSSWSSELRRALRLFNQHAPHARRGKLASPELQAIADRLDEYDRRKLLDYFRFLETEQIPLANATQATFERYLHRCAETRLLRNPHKRARQIARAWNSVRRTNPGFSLVALTAPRLKGPGSLALHRYPEPSFGEDIERYLLGAGGSAIGNEFLDNIFAEDFRPQAGRLLKPRTIETKRNLLRLAAHALVEAGQDPHELRSAMDLVSPPERAKMILRQLFNHFHDRKSRVPFRVAEELRLLARDHCRLSGDELGRIATFAKRLRPDQQMTMTAKNRERLRALTQPLPFAMLLHFPAELMRQAAAAKPRQAAMLAMYAAALEILLVCPLRLGNLLGLRLDRHLHRPDPRSSRITHLFFRRDEVKNKQDIEWPLPPESARQVEIYIRRYRSHLTTGENPFLFPRSDKPEPRWAPSFSNWLSRAVTREIGVSFNVHLARHFAAWHYLHNNPGQYEIVRQILGHSSIKTTIAHYVGLEADAAARRFDAIVLKERRATSQLARYAFRAHRGGLHARRRG